MLVTLVYTNVPASFNESVIELSEKSPILFLIGIAAVKKTQASGVPWLIGVSFRISSL
jgi:hypothetical protein